MATFSLQVITSNRIFYDGRANMVVIPGADGEMGIMAHHENMVVAVDSGAMRIQKTDGSWMEAAVSAGFASIANNRVKIIVYSAERPEEIDIKRAQEARERAEERLRQKQSIEEYHMSSAALARAMARIKEAGKVHPTGY
jgi:F-type H+-transporting ATPase subunit epsilon